MWRKGNLCTLLVGSLIGTATMEDDMEDPQKIKNKTTYGPAIPLLGLYLKETKTLTQKYIWTSMFIVALFTVAKIWKQPKCPMMDEWTHTHTMEYYSAIKKNKKIVLFVTT